MFSNSWNTILEWFRERSERGKLVRSFNESARDAFGNITDNYFLDAILLIEYKLWYTENP
jgi:hypothetical protein